MFSWPYLSITLTEHAQWIFLLMDVCMYKRQKHKNYGTGDLLKKKYSEAVLGGAAS
jgi:hypothetical protein